MGAKNSDHTSHQTITSSLFFELLHKAKVPMKKGLKFRVPYPKMVAKIAPR
jgi:hypothetical protein